MKLRLAALLVGLGAVGLSAPAMAQNPHFVGEPSCVENNACTTVTCTGKIAGVGTSPTTVTADIAGSGCVNNPGHEPRGHAQASSNPITPRGGSITFNVSPTVDCPPGLTPVFGDEACIFITQNGVTTQVDGCIDIVKPDQCN